MTRSADDAALLLAAIAGADPRDPATLRAPRFDAAAARSEAASLAGLRITVLPEDQYPVEVHASVRAAVGEAQRVLRELGAAVAERRLPLDFGELMRRNGQLIAAEAYSIHRDYIEDESLPLGPAVRKRVLGGKLVSAADYIAALEHRRAARAAWIEWMRETDALLSPAVPFPACAAGEVDESVTPLASFTRAGNYLDACGLALPAGFSDNGLPLAVQLLGKPFDEATLLRIGRAFQQATDWHRRRPDLGAIGLS